MSVLFAVVIAVVAASTAYPLGRARARRQPEPRPDLGPTSATPRVVIRVADTTPNAVQAVAEASDGYATARATCTESTYRVTSPGNTGQISSAEAAQLAADRATAHARELLRGAQAARTGQAHPTTSDPIHGGRVDR